MTFAWNVYIFTGNWRINGILLYAMQIQGKLQKANA